MERVSLVRIAVVYYSRTGLTARVVESLRNDLESANLPADVFKVLPIKEYSRPLHLNFRVLYETLVRRGTDIVLEPGEPDLESYDAVVLASPVWFNTLTPPAQEFLKRYRTPTKPLAVIATSALSISCPKIEERVMELCGVKPAYCVNVRAAMISHGSNLKQITRNIVKGIENL